MLGICREIFFGVGFFGERQGDGLCVLGGRGGVYPAAHFQGAVKVLSRAPNWRVGGSKLALKNSQ